MFNCMQGMSVKYFFFPNFCLRVKIVCNYGLWVPGNMHQRAGHHALVWMGQHALRGGNHAWGQGGGGGGRISCSVAENTFHSKTKAYAYIKTFFGVPVSLGRVPGVAADNFVAECELLQSYECRGFLLPSAFQGKPKDWFIFRTQNSTWNKITKYLKRLPAQAFLLQIYSSFNTPTCEHSFYSHSEGCTQCSVCLFV
jgi:hypothetical protein